MSQSPGPTPEPGPPARTPLLAIVAAALVGLVIIATTLVFVRPGRLWLGPAPPTVSGTSPLPSAPDLGPLGRAFTDSGFSCTLELTDPLIGGCYVRTRSGSQSMRWQGPGDRPIAISAYVFSDSTGYDFPAELGTVLARLPRSGIWTADDLTAVLRRLSLRDGQTADVDTSWGRVRLKATRYVLSLTGSRTGETARLVAARTFPTPMAELERTAATLGYRCLRSSTASEELSTCTDRRNNDVSISAVDGPAVDSLSGDSPSGTASSAFIQLVAVAAPADAAILSGLISEGAATREVSYRAGNGWLVLCTWRDPTTGCSVTGVSWE